MAGRFAAPMAAAVCVLLYGCGTIGEPLYPSLNIPVRILDLHVQQHADALVIDFTIPNLTTDGVTIKTIRRVVLQVGDRDVPVDKNAPGPVHVLTPVEGLAGQDVIVHVRLAGKTGHESDWSNAVTISVVAPLRIPTQLKAEGVPEGVKVTWTAPGENHFRIYRLDQKIGESDTSEYIDKTAEYGKTYEYSAQGVNGAAESKVSDAVSITPRDVFPPAVPTGLTASPGINSIELAWERNTEADFKGYRVYRSVDNGPFEPVGDMSEGPSFSDKNVVAGKHYRYAVSAVDQVGNESKQSAAAEITL
jgi:fibronectin type 3 domain-containing protein